MIVSHWPRIPRLIEAVLLAALVALASACSHESSTATAPRPVGGAATAPTAQAAALATPVIPATIAVAGSSPLATSVPTPLLATGQPVVWWFVFKFNSAAFPACHSGATRICLFGGELQDYGGHYGQQFVYASSQNTKLEMGSDCLGDSTADPVGATYNEVYTGDFYYVVWNDQFYNDPLIKQSYCDDQGCGKPWGHSKGLLAWNAAGAGLVMQVTTPNWPGAASDVHPRSGGNGNTLGCIHPHNNVLVSQHFFALRLSHADVVKVLTALANASVATDPGNLQIVRNGGPGDIERLVTRLGVRATSASPQVATLSSGVKLISKPAKLNVPPWQLVSAELGGVPLRVATWWMWPAIPSTTATTPIGCWAPGLAHPGAVENARSGQWEGTTFALTGGVSPDHNHAKIGVSTETAVPDVIFGDMNQQGSLSPSNRPCTSSQNDRGGLFFVIENATLAANVASLLQAESANVPSP